MTPLLWLCGAWLAGVAGGTVALLPVDTVALALGATGLAGLALAALRQRRAVALLGVLALALLGVWRTEVRRAELAEDPLADVRGTATLRGMVAQDPEVTDSASRWVLRVEQRRRPGAGWAPAEGDVLVWSRQHPAVQYGDRVQVTGKLEDAPSFDSFDYAAYLARQGVHGVIRYGAVRVVGQGDANPLLATALAWRRALAASLRAQIPEPQSALAEGIFLGVRTGIPRDLRDDFQRTGTTHILAISGENLGVVVGLLLLLGSRFTGRRSWAFVLAATAGLWGYSLLVGLPPSVARAAIMFTLALVASALGREPYALGGLAFAAAAMTLWDPIVLQDAGFQLSFAAMSGLLLLGPPLRRVLQPRLTPRSGPAILRALGRGASEGIAATLGATAGTLPVSALTFGQVTALALPATLFALPPMAPLLPIAAASAVLGMLPGPLAWLAWPFTAAAWLLATTMSLVVQAWARVPLASVQAPAGDLTWVAVYAGLLASVWVLVRRLSATPSPASGPPVSVRNALQGTLPAAGLAVLLAATGGVWWAALRPDDTARVHFLDVGEGDATLVESPSGRRVLVDGGPSGPVLTRELSAILPPWQRTIDLLVLTNPKATQVSGLLEVLQRYNVHAVAEGDQAGASPEYRAWERLLAERGVPRYRLARGASVELDGVALSVLHPGTPALPQAQPDSDASLVLAIDAMGTRMLLPGDIGLRGELALVEREAPVRSTVLKIGSRGAKDATSAAFVDAVTPAAAVISVGAHNTFGHPAAEVLQRLDRVSLFRTDLDGSVVVQIRPDGAVLQAATPRSPGR